MRHVANDGVPRAVEGLSPKVLERLLDPDGAGLEVGRVDYLRNLGLAEGSRPIKDFENVVVSAHLDFRSPARLDDQLLIDVRTKEIRKTSFTFEFRIRQKKTNQRVAEGYTIHCALDDEFKPMAVPTEFRDVIASFEGWTKDPA